MGSILVGCFSIFSLFFFIWLIGAFFVADVSESLRQLIPSNSVLVGKNIREQLKCLKLIEGYDYECVFDINSLFYIWNDEKQYYEFFSQVICLVSFIRPIIDLG